MPSAGSDSQGEPDGGQLVDAAGGSAQPDAALSRSAESVVGDAEASDAPGRKNDAAPGMAHAKRPAAAALSRTVSPSRATLPKRSRAAAEVPSVTAEAAQQESAADRGVAQAQQNSAALQSPELTPAAQAVQKLGRGAARSGLLVPSGAREARVWCATQPGATVARIRTVSTDALAEAGLAADPCGAWHALSGSAHSRDQHRARCMQCKTAHAHRSAVGRASGQEFAAPALPEVHAVTPAPSAASPFGAHDGTA
ncbi:hypothetical protein FVE85_7688 [Porphyridium purpureum]|uniref:Uncharacterized protein n=1 Tax=Porphyridium purpureum TaxID=35688 RepID=A0A5J4YHD9_PORPP|nr:hypothetical protein FVE85_7688 [Porphyridium purpureum]|eukprot:POR6668..scf213_38